MIERLGYRMNDHFIFCIAWNPKDLCFKMQSSNNKQVSHMMRDCILTNLKGDIIQISMFLFYNAYKNHMDTLLLSLCRIIAVHTEWKEVLLGTVSLRPKSQVCNLKAFQESSLILIMGPSLKSLQCMNVQNSHLSTFTLPSCHTAVHTVKTSSFRFSHIEASYWKACIVLTWQIPIKNLV